MAARTHRQDEAQVIASDGDDPRVVELLDMRAKAELAGDWQHVARAEWCLGWVTFKRLIAPARR